MLNKCQQLASESCFIITEKFDELDIAANSFLFLVAGFETTATTMSYCLYELAINQNVQEKLRSEVQEVKSTSKKLTYELLKGMTYLDAVISGELKHSICSDINQCFAPLQDQS